MQPANVARLPAEEEDEEEEEEEEEAIPPIPTTCIGLVSRNVRRSRSELRKGARRPIEVSARKRSSAARHSGYLCTRRNASRGKKKHAPT